MQISETKPARIYDVEFLRIVAAFSIVWFHSDVNFAKNLAYSGLIFFVLITVYFANSVVNDGSFLMKKARRYLVPWMIWLVIYGFGNLLLAKPFINLDRGILVGVLAGSHIHLWYLPFMFFIILIFDALRAISRQIVLLFCSVGFYTAYLVSYYWWRRWSLDFGEPLAQYVHALGAVFLGVVIATINSVSFKLQRILLAYMLITLLLSSVFLDIGLPYFVGSVFAYLAVNFDLNLPLRRFVSVVSPSVFGVYLIHPVFLYLLKPVFAGFLLPALAFAVSLFFVSFGRAQLPRFSRCFV